MVRPGMCTPLTLHTQIDNLLQQHTQQLLLFLNGDQQKVNWNKWVSLNFYPPLTHLNQCLLPVPVILSLTEMLSNQSNYLRHWNLRRLRIKALTNSHTETTEPGEFVFSNLTVCTSPTSTSFSSCLETVINMTSLEDDYWSSDLLRYFLSCSLSRPHVSNDRPDFQPIIMKDPPHHYLANQIVSARSHPLDDGWPVQRSWKGPTCSPSLGIWRYQMSLLRFLVLQREVSPRHRLLLPSNNARFN